MEEDKYKTLESLRETKKILNGIKGYLKEDEESVDVNFKFIITNNFKNKITDKVSNKKAYI